MEKQSKSPLTIAVIVIVIILIGLGIYALVKPSAPESNTAPLTQAQDEKSSLVQIVTVKHQYKNSIHTFAGTLDLPTPCQTLHQNVVKDAKIPNKYVIAFTTTNDSKDTACAQVITSHKFKVTVQGAQNADITATLDGQALQWNVIEVGPNENLDAFDINVKG